MLTKLVEKQTPESIHAHLGDIMPGLLKVNQYQANFRRKATLTRFCCTFLCIFMYLSMSKNCYDGWTYRQNGLADLVTHICDALDLKSFISRLTTTLSLVCGRPPSSASCPSTSWSARPHSRYIKSTLPYMYCSVMYCLVLKSTR